MYCRGMIVFTHLIKAVLGFLFALLAISAQATELANLYQVHISVKGQEKEERDNAFKVAMKQVLVKVSGHNSTLQEPIIQSKIETPAQYIKTYSYLRYKRKSGFLLKINFAKNRIDSLLVQQKQSLWGSSRPLTLFWIANKVYKKGFIVSHKDRSIRPELVSAMSQRGLPVRIPYVNAADKKRLGFQRLWNLSYQAIKEASKPYKANAILAGRLTYKQSLWRFQGSLLHELQRLPINIVAGTKQELAREISALVGEKLASQYAITAKEESAEKQKMLQVVGVNSFSSYYSLLKYLQKKPGIEKVITTHIQDDKLTLKLSLSAPWSQVDSTIRLDKKLMVDFMRPNYWRWYK